jgi:hypothetical protein
MRGSVARPVVEARVVELAHLQRRDLREGAHRRRPQRREVAALRVAERVGEDAPMRVRSSPRTPPRRARASGIDCTYSAPARSGAPARALQREPELARAQRLARARERRPPSLFTCAPSSSPSGSAATARWRVRAPARAALRFRLRSRNGDGRPAPRGGRGRERARSCAWGVGYDPKTFGFQSRSRARPAGLSRRLALPFKDFMRRSISAGGTSSTGRDRPGVAEGVGERAAAVAVELVLDGTHDLRALGHRAATRWSTSGT